ncbi:uncharacterized protein YhfF [Stackebrandtia endophytica]|uniref:Uncharacterized protein YhfF n=1 Tax=Stackebrandtia endophytica TaxID=1496996 RepID=A0A543ATL1_9ACTN|nr:ASCH domain-containing protein [Stackebrandtia endophytica]TQL75876.1 uncharacterized protein YhfF [Stackebrandtia endophytica]
MTKSPAAPDLAAATRMWADYASARPESVTAGPEYTVEHFGDSAALADELLNLVLSGEKRATAELVSEFAARGDNLPRIGSHWIACDSTGTPRIIIRTTELRIGDFTTADAAFAFDEAEGDRSLTTWQEGHRRYWHRTCEARGATWSESDDIVFERFQVAWPLELAD